MFSDPFGLCPEWKTGVPCVTPFKGGLVPAGVVPGGRSERSGALGSEYGKTRFLAGSSQTRDKPHSGFDDAAPVMTAISAAGDGRLSYDRSDNNDGGIKATLRLDSGYTVVYNHLDASSLPGATDSRVGAGDVLGYVGQSGNSAGSGRNPHVHITVIKPGGGTCNPQDFFAATGGGKC